MIKKILLSAFFFAHGLTVFAEEQHNIALPEQVVTDQCNNERLGTMKKQSKNVHKFVLENGLTVLVVPVKQASQVAAQIWYNVGSKHEMFGERGMAHFIEHMVFKGTDEMLSESDSNIIGSKLSAYVNAGTWYDFTFYYFTLPLANWDKVLPVFADWMQNCRFRQDHMDSEVKAVIQELKMSNDNYSRFLMLNMISTIFDSHPYHYTTIGFKQDLWALKRDTLVKFYKKHYTPQNATVVLVGDLDPEKARDKIQEYFGKIPRGADIPELKTYMNEDISSKAVTIYRDVEQSIGSLCFVIPGMSKKVTILSDILGALLANGKSSRLYKKLVDETSLVAGISANDIGTHDYNVFYVEFKPICEKDFDTIKGIIFDEIQNIIAHGLTDLEMRRAMKSSQMEKQQQLESVQGLAQKLGWTYVATDDEEYMFESYEGKEKELKEELISFLKKYFRASQCHEGRVCKISDADKKHLEELQQVVAQTDGAALAELARESVTEAPKYAHSVIGEKVQKKEFVKPEIYTLDNGLEVMLCKTESVDTVSCLLQMRADSSYGPDGFDGAFDLVYKMMIEGTRTYPGLTFAQEVESYGIDFNVSPGVVTCEMLSVDVSKGLDFMRSVVSEAQFEQDSFDRVKEKQKSLIAAFWDEPRNIRMQRAKELIYKDHPYSKCLLGTEHSLKKIDRNFCVDLYRKFVSPVGARLTIVGNFNPDTIKKEVQQAFGSWNGQQVDKLVCPVLKQPKAEQICIEKNRDQVFMGFVGLSVNRFDPAYDALLIFDQILTGSALPGMDTLLFRLREQTGLFYNAGGSIIMGADEEPGMVYIATMVARDRVQEACDAFMKTLTTSIDSVTDEEFELARENIIASYCKRYDTNMGRAATFNSLRRYNFPFDYFEKRFDVLRNYSKEKMIVEVKKLLNADNLSCIKIGKWSDKVA